MSYDNRLSVAGVLGAKRRRWSRARPKHKSFPGSDFYRSLADILAARTGGNGKLPADLVHHPPIVMTAVVTGLCSCTRQLFVCWPGAGNQGPPNYWTFSIIIFLDGGVCIIQEAQQGDEVTGCCSSRINVEYNTTTTSLVTFHRPHFARSSHVSHPVQHKSPSCLLVLHLP